VYIFLSLSLADYGRYLCEIVTDDAEKRKAYKETEEFYKNFFDIASQSNMHVVNPSSLTGYFHYCIFVFEILGRKDEAIQMLKEKHQQIIDNLDTAYNVYIDSYSILELITETLTVWIISTNYQNINNVKAL
jgi:hypothetical protein